MHTYLVSYDLADPGFNRNALNSAIMMLGEAWARPLAQTWYVKTNLGEEDIDSVLRGLLQADDGLVIQAVDDEARLTGTQMRWFRQRPLLKDAPATNVVAFPVVTEPAASDNDREVSMPLAEAG